MIRPITPRESEIAGRVVGSTAFYGLVVDALLNRRALSVIRVSDGEKRAMEYAENNAELGPHAPLLCCDAGFRQRFGVEGISCSEISSRVYAAVSSCTHFAPTLGFFNPIYHVLPFFSDTMDGRKPLVEELFQYQWNQHQRFTLMRLAKRVTVINRDPEVSKRLSRALPDVMFSQVLLDNWREADNTRVSCFQINNPLVLMSAALGSKYIGPLIAEASNAVVLDIGQACETWHL